MTEQPLSPSLCVVSSLISDVVIYIVQEPTSRSIHSPLPRRLRHGYCKRLSLFSHLRVHTQVLLFSRLNYVGSSHNTFNSSLCRYILYQSILALVLVSTLCPTFVHRIHVHIFLKTLILPF